MIKDDLFQAYYLKEEQGEPLDRASSKYLKWECLGAACPSSCCFHFSLTRISIQEIVPLSRYFPVVFCVAERGDRERGIDICILMKMVMDSGGCTYLQKGAGCLLRDDKPLSCKQYPFRAARDEGGNNTILVRIDCPGFSGEHGHPVMTPDNTISSRLGLECINPAIIRSDGMEETRRFVETIISYDLIASGQYNYRGESIPFNFIEAKRVSELPKEVRDDFRRRGYMELIFAHMSSLPGTCAKLIDTYLERKAAQETDDTKQSLNCS